MHSVGYAQGFSDALRVCAELEASRRRARQADGIAKAKAAGAYKGRRPSIDRDAIQRLHAEGLNPGEIAQRVGCGRASVYRVLQAECKKNTR